MKIMEIKYDKDYMKIKFDSDDDLPLNKILKLHMLSFNCQVCFSKKMVNTTHRYK